MSEILPQNEHPLNQVANAALHRLKVHPDPEFLYATQLMRLALDKKKTGFLRSQILDLYEWMDVAERHHPDNVMKFITETALGEPMYPNPKEMGLWPEWDVANVLLDNLQTKIRAVL